MYLRGYDGHCLRAYYYFKDKMPDIEQEYLQANTEEEQVNIINSIASRYKKLRQLSKAPSFALTYGGSYITLMKNCGFSEEVAKQIEQAYHELYVVSDNWVKAHIDRAKITGYVSGAFDLKVRTPMLKNAGYSLTSMQSAESRTAGNALGQGWGLLNNRAMREVLNTIDKEGYTNDIYPIAAIHDAAYYMVRNDIPTILWLNEITVKASLWQEHEAIYHPKVKLGGQLDLFIPDWSNPLTLPEQLTEPELISLVQNHINKPK